LLQIIYYELPVYYRMLTKRIIPCLDIKDGRTVKGVNFVELRDAGDPVALAKLYSEQGADELVFLDITATVDKRKTLVELVTQVAKEVRIPFTVGGGIGFESGYSMDVQYIFAEKKDRYTAENIQEGKGFAFSIEAGPLNYSRSGDQDASGFGWFGKSLTGNGGSVSALLPRNALSLTKYNEVIKMLSQGLGGAINVKGGISFQWTQGYGHKSF
jgi:hypothetical protein